MKIITHGKFGKELAEHYKNNRIENLQIDYLDNLTQEIIDQYDGWAAFSPPKNLEISHIKWIHSFAAGVDNYTRRTDLNPELILTKSVGDMARKMAEYCLAQIMLNAQNCLKLYDNQRSSSWLRYPPKMLRGEVVALLGTGFMAKGIADLLRAIGMKTTGINRNGNDSDNFDLTFSFAEFKKNPPAISYLISTLPSTPNNYHLLDDSFFGKFQKIHFINCGRGDVVDEDALLSALERGNISLASLDVFEQEPLAHESKLWNHPKIIISPHQASLTSCQDVLESFAIALEAVLNNQKCELKIDLKLGY